MTYRSRVGAELNALLGEPNTMFIYDGEIRKRYGDKADAIIAALDKDPATQCGKATRPPSARYRPAVEEYLRLRAQR